jgi:hypothetical protein
MAGGRSSCGGPLTGSGSPVRRRDPRRSRGGQRQHLTGLFGRRWLAGLVVPKAGDLGADHGAVCDVEIGE